MDTLALAYIWVIVVVLVGAVAFVVPIARTLKWKREKAEAEESRRAAEKAESDFQAWCSTASLDEIWGIADRERFLHAIDLWLVRKEDRHINSGCEAPALSPAERAAYDVLAFDLHAYFNGLYDFWLCYGYDGSAGAYEVALREIGAVPAADLWHDAAVLIEGSSGDPEDPMPDDPGLARALSMLDFGYRENSEKAKELLYQYIQRHKSEFSE